MKKQLLLSSAIATAMLLSACGDNASTSNTRTPLVKPQVSKPADTPSKPADTTAQTKPADNQTKPETSSNATDTNSSGSSSSSSNGSSNAGGSSSSGTASGSSSGGHGHGHSHAGGSSSGGSSSGSSGSGSHSGAGSSGSSSGGTASGGTGSGSTTTPPATTPPSTNPPATGTTPPTAGGSTTTPPASGGTGSGGTASGSGSTTTPPSTGTTPTTPPISTNPVVPPSTGSSNPSNFIGDIDVWKQDLTNRFQNKNQNLDGFVIKIGEKSYVAGTDVLDLKALGQGFKVLPYADTITTTDQKTGKKTTYERTGEMYLFQQKHSVVSLINPKKTVTVITENGTQQQKVDTLNDWGFLTGEPVNIANLPKTGSYHYVGEARLARSHLNPNNDTVDTSNSDFKQGKFNYSIDFDTRKGKGSVSESGGLVITLKETDFLIDTKNSLAGVPFGEAESNLGHKGSYDLLLFGENAQEVAGNLRQLFDEKGEFVGGFFVGQKQ